MNHGLRSTRTGTRDYNLDCQSRRKSRSLPVGRQEATCACHPATTTTSNRDHISSIAIQNANHDHILKSTSCHHILYATSTPTHLLFVATNANYLPAMLFSLGQRRRGAGASPLQWSNAIKEETVEEERRERHLPRLHRPLRIWRYGEVFRLATSSTKNRKFGWFPMKLKLNNVIRSVSTSFVYSLSS